MIYSNYIFMVRCKKYLDDYFVIKLLQIFLFSRKIVFCFS